MIGNANVRLIAALGHGHVIGDGQTMGFSDREDMRYFKNNTIYNPVVMGRRTRESLPHGALKDRLNIVLSRSLTPGYLQPNLVVVPDLERLRMLVEVLYPDGPPSLAPLWVMGGGEIYREFLPYADELWLTRMDVELPGSVTFPDWDTVDFECRQVIEGPSPEDGREPNRYQVWSRR